MAYFLSVAQEASLVLSTKELNCEVGDHVEFKLSLEDVNGELTGLDSTDRYVDFSPFVKKIVVAFTEKGMKEVGPYQLSWNGKTLESNTLTVEVHRSSVVYDQEEMRIRIVAPSKVIKGEEFVLSIKSTKSIGKSQGNSNDFFSQKSKTLSLNHSKLEIVNRSVQSSVKMQNGKTSAEYTYNFHVKAKKKGQVVIDENSFDPPLSLDLDITTIEVEKK